MKPGNLSFELSADWRRLLSRLFGRVAETKTSNLSRQRALKLSLPTPNWLLRRAEQESQGKQTNLHDCFEFSNFGKGKFQCLAGIYFHHFTSCSETQQVLYICLKCANLSFFGQKQKSNVTNLYSHCFSLHGTGGVWFPTECGSYLCHVQYALISWHFQNVSGKKTDQNLKNVFHTESKERLFFPCTCLTERPVC